MSMIKAIYPYTCVYIYTITPCTCTGTLTKIAWKYFLEEHSEVFTPWNSCEWPYTQTYFGIINEKFILFTLNTWVCVKSYANPYNGDPDCCRYSCVCTAGVWKVTSLKSFEQMHLMVFIPLKSCESLLKKTTKPVPAQRRICKSLEN